MSEGARRVGKQIRAARRAREWSQGRLEAGVARGSLARLELGRAPDVRLSTVEALAAVLGFEVALVRIEDE